MYKRRTDGAKRDPLKRWSLPDRVFFACGACHILAHVFLRTYPDSGFVPIWIRPEHGYTGHHIVLCRSNLAFDYHGYSSWPRLLTHARMRARQWWPGWDADTLELPEEVLVSGPKSQQYKGLWLREPGEFLFDPRPRAERYIRRFPAP
jgi:hypothetical protein